MHDQRSPSAAEAEDDIDRAVLTLLMDDQARLWSDEEVVREVGDRIDVTDSLARLYGAGLVHRLEGFVFATRPALRGAQIAG